MELHTAGWSGLWTLAIVFFVVIPSIRWSIGGGRWGVHYGRRRARRYSRHWGADLDREDDDDPSRKQLDAFREELDSRLAEIDTLHGRVAELENRLDFTERLLAERHEQPLVKDSAAS
jgi:hypothetical protein